MPSPHRPLPPAALSSLTDRDPLATAQLMEQVYDQLRSLASAYMSQQPEGHTLQPTALVHEAFLKVADRSGESFTDRAHFAAVCATAMRSILTDHARRRRATKRGGGWSRVELSVADTPSDACPIDALALDEALNVLAERNELQARIVEYRFFGGMTVAEVTQVLRLPRSSIEDLWRMARAWLTVQLRRNDPP